MAINSLRDSKERNSLIDVVYCTFLNRNGELGKISLERLSSLMETAKKLAALGDIMERGKREGSFMSLEAYLQGCSWAERAKRTEEYYLSAASISDELLENFKKQMKAAELGGSTSKEAMTTDQVARLCKSAGHPIFLSETARDPS